SRVFWIASDVIANLLGKLRDSTIFQLPGRLFQVCSRMQYAILTRQLDCEDYRFQRQRLQFIPGTFCSFLRDLCRVTGESDGIGGRNVTDLPWCRAVVRL